MIDKKIISWHNHAGAIFLEHQGYKPKGKKKTPEEILEFAKKIGKTFFGENFDAEIIESNDEKVKLRLKGI